MASIVDKVKELIRSPEGRALADRVKQTAKDPRTKRRVQDVRRRIRRR